MSDLVDSTSKNLKHLKFPFKLFSIVSDPTSEAIRWNETGKAICIQKDLFQKEYLHNNIFKSAKYWSFIRQLNLYGFKKDRAKTLADTDVFRHDFFCRNFPLLDDIKRKSPRKLGHKIHHDRTKRDSMQRRVMENSAKNNSHPLLQQLEDKSSMQDGHHSIRDQATLKSEITVVKPDNVGLTSTDIHPPAQNPSLRTDSSVRKPPTECDHRKPRVSSSVASSANPYPMYYYSAYLPLDNSASFGGMRYYQHPFYHMLIPSAHFGAKCTTPQSADDRFVGCSSTGSGVIFPPATYPNAFVDVTSSFHASR